MKLAAFDIDGTILFPDGVAEETVRVIHSWRDAGHLAVAATGKSSWAMRYSLERSGVLFDYSVLYTGAVVADEDGETLHSSTLDTGIVRRISRELVDVDGIAVYGTALGRRDVRFSSHVPEALPNPVLHDFEELPHSEIDDREFVGVPIWVPGDPDLKRELRAWITDSFDVDCVVNQDFLDVIPPGTDKAAGLGWLAGHLGVERGEVELYTFGDSWNDLPMHAIADRSFSFPWSPPEVHAATDEVIGSVAEALPGLMEWG